MRLISWTLRSGSEHFLSGPLAVRHFGQIPKTTGLYTHIAGNGGGKFRPGEARFKISQTRYLQSSWTWFN
jgi:hypothetical protein